MGNVTDMADDFNALKSILREQSIRKRQHNRESSPQVLDRYGVEYETRNDGIHLIVRGGEGNGTIVDFWPGTGKWIARDATKSSGRGVFRMIEWLGVKG
jgi:hypothetical protein